MMFSCSRAEKISYYKSVDSTSSFLKKLASEGAADGRVVIAERQSAGRGRMGRGFESPEGKGVYLSFLMRPEAAPETIPMIAPCTVVAGCRAIYRACGIKPSIKWVNDILIGERKIAGILAETASSEGRVLYVVIGIGINTDALPEDFSEGLRGKAGSIYSETGCRCDRMKLIYELITELDRMNGEWPEISAEYLQEYRAGCITPGRQVIINDFSKEQNAFALEIADDFGLMVRLEDGSIKKITGGEATIRGTAGYCI